MHINTHTLEAFILTGNLLSHDEKSPDAFGRQKSPKHNYLCTQVLGVYLQADLHYTKSELMKILFYLCLTLAWCISEVETGHEYSELQHHSNK